MNVLKDVIRDVKYNKKIDVSRFGLFKKRLSDNEIGFTPFDNSLKNIRVYYKINGDALLIYFFVKSENQISIREAEELLGGYQTGYNWRDCFTRFNFNGIQNEYIEGIYFDKNNEIIVDKEKNQYIENDHSGNVTIQDYSKLCFDGFVIKYK
jgi:hypothetical protein